MCSMNQPGVKMASPAESSSRVGRVSFSESENEYEEAAQTPTQPADEPDEFPKFTDGDVEFDFQDGRRMCLHSNTLRASSGMFQRLLTEKHANMPKPSKKRREAGDHVRWRLKVLHAADGDTILIKTDKGAKMENAPTAWQRIENGKIPNTQERHWRNTLRCFYQIPIQVDKSSIEATLVDVMGMVEVAKYLECAQVVGGPVENCIISLDQVCWKSMANDPCPWAQLAYHIRGSVILKEALIHLVGKWHSLDAEQKEMLNPRIAEFAESKYQKLCTLKLSVERELVGYLPESLTRSQVQAEAAKVNGKTAGIVAGRASYSEDIYPWISLHIFKVFLGIQLAEEGTRKAPDGGYSFFHGIRVGDQAYMTDEEIRLFHNQCCHMTTRGRSSFLNHVKALKEDVKKYVKPIFVNEARCNVAKHPVTHFTCTKITDMDLDNLRASAMRSGKKRAASEILESVEDAHEHTKDSAANVEKSGESSQTGKMEKRVKT